MPGYSFDQCLNCLPPPAQILTGSLISFSVVLSLFLLPFPFFFSPLMHSKLIFSLSLAFLLGLVTLVCSQKGPRGWSSQPCDSGCRFCPSLDYLGCEGVASAHPQSRSRAASNWSGAHIWPSLSLASSFSRVPHECPTMVSSAHESTILFPVPYSSFTRGRKDRSYCFQEVCFSRGRPVYKTTLVTNVCYYNRTLLTQI